MTSKMPILPATGRRSRCQQRPGTFAGGCSLNAFYTGDTLTPVGYKVKFFSVFEPKVVLIATSAASPP